MTPLRMNTDFHGCKQMTPMLAIIIGVKYQSCTIQSFISVHLWSSVA